MSHLIVSYCQVYVTVHGGGIDRHYNQSIAELSDLLGRKAVLLLSGVFFVLGAAVLGTALQGAVW